MIAAVSLKCIRCASLLEPVDSHFFRCCSCERQYAVASDNTLVDRWLSPLTIPLYSIIFSNNPQDDASRVAEQLNEKTPEERSSIVAEIRDELANPKQKVHLIHDLADKTVTEQDVREFLRLVADKTILE